MVKDTNVMQQRQPRASGGGGPNEAANIAVPEVNLTRLALWAERRYNREHERRGDVREAYAQEARLAQKGSGTDASAVDDDAAPVVSVLEAWKARRGSKHAQASSPARITSGKVDEAATGSIGLSEQHAIVQHDSSAVTHNVSLLASSERALHARTPPATDLMPGTLFLWGAWWVVAIIGVWYLQHSRAARRNASSGQCSAESTAAAAERGVIWGWALSTVRRVQAALRSASECLERRQRQHAADAAVAMMLLSVRRAERAGLSAALPDEALADMRQDVIGVTVDGAGAGAPDYTGALDLPWQLGSVANGAEETIGAALKSVSKVRACLRSAASPKPFTRRSAAAAAVHPVTFCDAACPYQLAPCGVFLSSDRCCGLVASRTRLRARHHDGPMLSRAQPISVPRSGKRGTATPNGVLSPDGSDWTSSSSDNSSPPGSRMGDLTSTGAPDEEWADVLTPCQSMPPRACRPCAIRRRTTLK